jgi:hypothetical protein
MDQREVTMMKATFLLAVSAAGVFGAISVAQAQDMQMDQTQGATTQQSVQTDTNTTSYGGTTNGTKSAGMSQSTWTSGTSSTCITGLSCNIYQGN